MFGHFLKNPKKDEIIFYILIIYILSNFYQIIDSCILILKNQQLR
jgi:hypothetical protein